VILIPQFESELILTQLISRIKKALAEPFQIDSNKIHMSISIGQGTYPYNGTDALKLLRYVELEIKNTLR
jgi:GGDEF domain-containing protein